MKKSASIVQPEPDKSIFFLPRPLTIIYFIGATLDLQWMTAINQNHEKCTTEQIWWSSYVDSYLQQ